MVAGLRWLAAKNKIHLADETEVFPGSLKSGGDNKAVTWPKDLRGARSVGQAYLPFKNVAHLIEITAAPLQMRSRLPDAAHGPAICGLITPPASGGIRNVHECGIVDAGLAW